MNYRCMLLFVYMGARIRMTSLVGVCGPLCVIAQPFKTRLPAYLLACQIALPSNVCVMSSAQMITFTLQSQLQKEVIGFQYQD